MKEREIKMIFLGGISPLIGALIFLFQMHINPHGFYRYMAIQSIISIIFLMYFVLCASFFSSKQYKKTNIVYFFAIPFLLIVVTTVFRKMLHRSPIVAIILSGMGAPFHYVLPDLYFPADKFFLVPTLFPVVVCLISFKIGEKVGVYFKKRKLR